MGISVRSRQAQTRSPRRLVLAWLHCAKGVALARPRLQTKAAQDEEFLFAYYAELQRSPQFREELINLQGVVDLPVQFPYEVAGSGDDSFLEWTDMSTDQARRIAAFAYRWALPKTHGAMQVAWALRMAVRRENGIVDLSLTATRRFNPAGHSNTRRKFLATIEGVYDPTVDARPTVVKYVDRAGDVARRTLLAALDGIESDAGRKGFLKARQSRQEIQRFSQAIYLRAVKGMRWKAIAEVQREAAKGGGNGRASAEHPGDRFVPTEENVSRVARKWATYFEIPISMSPARRQRRVVELSLGLGNVSRKPES